MVTTVRYLWAFFPGTVIGLLCVPLALAAGGNVQFVRGCFEVHGGLVTRFLRRGVPLVGIHGAAAMTLGHVIIGIDERCLARSRDHEHVHVRQYERWGPFFLPAYVAASGIAWYRGQHAYLDNHFEREAYGREP
jgi:hypothetical protein